MNWLPKKLSKEQNEERRLKAAELLNQNEQTMIQRQIALYLGVSEANLSQWKKEIHKPQKPKFTWDSSGVAINRWDYETGSPEREF